MSGVSRFTVVDRADDAEPEGVEYDVLLLAGSPRRHTVRLGPDVVEGAQIVVDGEQWTVADVRPHDGERVQLVCIYPA